ncbi:sugar phosphate nucleotidyltransferase [Azospirillum thermophilum]|uniref:Mannose-1-phosphate guanylyltransferase/mannose-6-phosphate isomerase n=1 Tax=Azospirillum thermophilum TaxID=2202148 RepID=A0A2S2CW14_9PROT|nr:sugar phosphate nucleotidyltransferase [Azospirillum thermophilum]AWK88477.1 mannose-1-phosphate guanylyltransferase/mannose-6-phosphate isomerase [Azospirillum thermophilum]
MEIKRPQPQIHPVLLCGENDHGLWPLSRELFPKEFLPLLAGRSLLQEAAERVSASGPVAAPIIACNEEHRFMAAEQLRRAGVSPAVILLEPVWRGAAVTAAAAALMVAGDDPDGLLLLVPVAGAQSIGPAFADALATAHQQAAEGKLVSIGDPAGGCWLFRAARYLEELARHAPETLAAARQALDGRTAGGGFLQMGAAPASAPALSVAAAIDGKTDHAAAVPCEIDWSGTGSWSTLWNAGGKDEDGNVRVGDVVTSGTRNCYIQSDGHLAAVVGLEDAVVVVTDDAVLVARKDQEETAKALLRTLKDQGRSEVLNHRKVHRPWGTFQSLHMGKRFQVKCLTVEPGCRLSLQRHHHRAEHWVVVQGTALVTCGTEVRLVSENESVYIPIGTNHRLENPGKVPLSIIEVQSGSYLGEDDIVRIEDVYGRVECA